ncbi:MAG: hypothetical protein WDM76_06380 [Limisphaerales bacterium]
MSMGDGFQNFEKELNRLVESFGKCLTELKQPGYAEAQLRDDFLNPFFRALGWGHGKRKIIFAWRFGLLLDLGRFGLGDFYHKFPSNNFLEIIRTCGKPVLARRMDTIAAGTDEVINLVDSIEVLHTDIWRLGLQMLSDEYLGYQTKLNQIKNLEVELVKLKSDFEKGIATKSELEMVLTSARQANESLTGQLDALKISVEKVATDAEKIQAVEQNAAASLKIVQKNEEINRLFTSHSRTVYSDTVKPVKTDEIVSKLIQTIQDFLMGSYSPNTFLNRTKLIGEFFWRIAGRLR